MKLEVRLFAQFRELVSKETRGVVQVEVPEGSTGKELIEQLKLPRDYPIILMVNGRRVTEDLVLQEEDRVALFPPVGGG